VVEQRRISETNGAGTSPPRDSPSTPRRRRLLDTPANDNVPSLCQRLLRAAVFVVIGSVLAYLLREIFG